LKTSNKLLLACIIAVLGLAIYGILSPWGSSRRLVEIELPLPPEVTSVIDHSNYSIEYAPVPTIEEANQYLDTKEGSHLQFLNTHLMAGGKIKIEVALIITRTPLGRIISEEATCRAVIVRIRKTNGSDGLKQLYAIQIPSTVDQGRTK